MQIQNNLWKQHQTYERLSFTSYRIDSPLGTDADFASEAVIKLTRACIRGFMNIPVFSLLGRIASEGALSNTNTK